MIQTRRLLVRGRVQGVGYREAMRTAAGRLGCTGWVRNRVDGRVEAIVQGAPESIESLLAWARRGPPAARVDEIEVEDAEGCYADFVVGPTI